MLATLALMVRLDYSVSLLHPNSFITNCVRILSCQREITIPLANKTGGSTNDTGFWKGVEKALDDAYDNFGKDSDRHKSPAWDV